MTKPNIIDLTNIPPAAQSTPLVPGDGRDWSYNYQTDRVRIDGREYVRADTWIGLHQIAFAARDYVNGLLAYQDGGRDLADADKDLADRADVLIATLKRWSELGTTATPSPRHAVLAEIAAERSAQDAQWGGPAHDDMHGLTDWFRFRGKFERRILGAGVPLTIRNALVKIAALAAAQIESLDRVTTSGDREDGSEDAGLYD